MIRQFKQRFQDRMRRIRAEPVSQLVVVSNFLDVTQRKFFIGEISCRNNARSPHLRCAINPSGPCEGCLHYEVR